MTERIFLLIVLALAIAVLAMRLKWPDKLSELAASAWVLGIFAAALFVTDAKGFVRSMLMLQISMNVLYGVAGCRHLRLSLPKSKARYLYVFVGVFVFLMVEEDIIRLAGML